MKFMQPFDITNNQILLIKAAIFPVEEALPCWEKWCANQQLTDPALLDDGKLLPRIFDTIDMGSIRLMPMVYRNLEKTQDPFVPQLRRIYRNTWSKNQYALQKVNKAIEALQAAGIETMLLKGLAMGLVYYKDMGVRLTSDGDVLVSTKDLARALEVLAKTTQGYKVASLDKSMKAYIHAAHLFSLDNFDFDIHWHLLFFNRTPEADAPFWQHKRHYLINGNTPTTILSPTHQVLHNLVHGNFPDVQVPIRWVADCYVIYQNYEIDWLEILNMAEERRFLVPVMEGIRLLRQEFKLKLQPVVLDRLRQLKPIATESAYHSFLKKNMSKTSVPTKAFRFYHKSRFEYELYHAQYYQEPYFKYATRKLFARSYAYVVSQFSGK